PSHEPRDVVVAHNAGGQTLRAVRRERANLPLLRIEPECDEALVVHPEVAIESLLQLARTPPQLEPARAVTRCGRQRSHELERHVVVALDLARGDRRIDLTPILVDDGVLAVLPALVPRAVARLRQILDVAVAIAIAVLLRPLEHALRRIH